MTEDATAEPLVIAPGRLLSGVVSQDGVGAPDVEVEVWCLTAAGASLPCARATTDGLGHYALLLPASME